MTKGLVYAAAAAVITFAAITWATHLISASPGMAAPAPAGARAADDAQLASLTDSVRSYERVVADQRSLIGALEAEIEALRAADPAAPAAASPAPAPSDSADDPAERTRLVAGQEALWLEVQRLDTRVAAYRAQLAEGDTKARAQAAQIARLNEELDQKEQSVGTLMRQITALRSTRDRRPATGTATARPAPAPARPATVTAPPDDDTIKSDGPAPASADTPTAANAAPHSVEDGAAAYRDGDYAAAFAIWQALAEAGNAQARFHLGALYFEGRGTAKDLVLARQWLSRAVNDGDKRAATLLARIDPTKTR